MTQQKDITRAYKGVATKLSKEANLRLERIASMKHMSKYELVQMVCDTLIRYMDDRHNLSSEMEKAMSIFEHMEGWSDAFNLADPTVQWEVGEATYYIQDPTGKKHGVRAVHVTKPYFNHRTMTENIQEIFERTLCMLTPERYRRLRSLAVDRGCSSLLELFDTIIDQYAADSDVAHIRRQFEDASRGINNRPVEYGQRTRRKHHKDIESDIFNHQTQDNEKKIHQDR